MKRILSTIILLTMVLVASTAATLKIGGVSININQSTGYCGDGLTSGYYNYDYNRNQLNFFSASIAGDIYSDVEGLTIVFNNMSFIMNIELHAQTCIVNAGSVIMTGCLSIYDDVNLDCGTWEIDAIQCFTIQNNSKLTIKDVDNMTAKGSTESTYYDSPVISGGTLEVNNSTLKVEAPTQRLCTDSKVVLKDCAIASPLRVTRCSVSGTRPNYTFQPVYSASEPACLVSTKGNDYLRGNLTIKPGTTYDLWICGVQVNSLNNSSIWQLETMGSTANVASLSFNPSKKTLMLLNSTQLNSQNSIFPPIHNEIDGLIIDVSGGPHIIGNSNTSGSNGIETLAECIIRGGILYVYGHDNGKAIYAKNSCVYFISLVLTAGNGDYGLYGEGNSFITVENSFLTISGTKSAIYVKNNGFDLSDNCFITAPENGIKSFDCVCTVDPSTGAMTPATNVTTRPLIKYEVWIDGNEVTEMNCNNPLSSNNANSGTMQFIPSTNTLKLNSVNTGSDFNSIYSYISTRLPQLNIELQGDSYIYGYGPSSKEGLFSSGNVKIGGNGNLHFYGHNHAVDVDDLLELTGNVEVDVLGNEFGVSAGSLVMSANTKLRTRANPLNQGKSLIISHDPMLNGVALPSDMYYDSTLHCVAYLTTGSPVSDCVMINAVNAAGLVTDINEITPVEEAGETSIYTTSGTLVWQGAGQPQLPRGIYIMKKNGKVQKVQKN